MRRALQKPLGSFDTEVYIDDIGVPRGIPNEYKARNQIAAGFESSLCWWCTTNKNVDWINYLYYNQQRFINQTHDAVGGIAEQLAATSQMSWENRMATDMLLADKGGVCTMFGDSCCTYIPNNTAPDGSVTKALEGLRSLREELKRHSGYDDTSPWGWFDVMFGKWKAFILSLFTGVVIGITALTLCGCCLIPCAPWSDREHGAVERCAEEEHVDSSLEAQCWWWWHVWSGEAPTALPAGGGAVWYLTGQGVTGNRHQGGRPFQFFKNSETVLHLDRGRWSNGLVDKISCSRCPPMSPFSRDPGLLCQEEQARVRTGHWSSDRARRPRVGITFPAEATGPDHGSVTSVSWFTEQTAGWIETVCSM
ncbi:hypothetical protein Q8A73_000159 [Channa argus]|nr:hypothetical protein Q8A73_000159 [Channa argus]